MADCATHGLDQRPGSYGVSATAWPGLSLLVAGLMTMAYGLPAQADTWVLEPQSDIRFEFTQLGAKVGGTFDAFTATADFDLDAPAACRFSVEIDVDSLNTQNRERDAILRSTDLFDVATYPTARFEGRNCKNSLGFAWTAEGRLTIRDVTRDVRLPFTLKFADRPDGRIEAVAEATLSLNRLDYGIGQGVWSNTTAVGEAVYVRITMAGHPVDTPPGRDSQAADTE